MEVSILARKDRISLGNGMDLRLLSAMEVLEARREAAELAGEERERALCSNACLLAKALERSEDKTAVFSGGEQVLKGMTVEEIGVLAQRWSQFRKENEPLLSMGEDELELLKKNSVQTGKNGCTGKY